MPNRLDPLAASDTITDTYHRYIQTFVDVRDEQLSEAFRRAVADGEKLTKGPLLEATPAYAQGATLRQLIQEEVLSRSFARLDSAALPLDRPLFRHQEQAVRKVRAGRNVVVTTGTGSGKTESFLIPILDHLMRERDAGTLGSGVRALLLYPMNALANDQVKRLRGLLKGQPDITFGRYTGETTQTLVQAERHFAAVNSDEPRIANELMSRDQMRNDPPHILLTNYAMLEYLLLRPVDMELFGGDTWSFVVLDEAHVYAGAKGAEIAMLLRRLHDRVAAERPLQFIATSASLTGSRTDVMTFATKLFDATFEWDEHNNMRQDQVLATRVRDPSNARWGPMSLDEIDQIARTADSAREIVEAARRSGYIPSDPADALGHEQTIVSLRDVLTRGPLSVVGIAGHLWPTVPTGRAKQALNQLVSLAAAVRDGSGNPVISARYHLFVRATEGAFTCLSATGPHVQLGRHEVCPDCEAACFEFGACQRCGAVYLAGQVQHVGKDRIFVPPFRPEQPISWLVLDDASDADDITDEDDVAVEEAASRPAAKGPAPAALCTACGRLHPTGTQICSTCGGIALRIVRRYERSGATMATCARCGARSREVVKRLNTGADAPPAVLTTALYQCIPGADGEAVDLPGEGRKLLLFSDSRQSAAFAAPYLQSTYGTIQARRIIVEALRRPSGGSEIGYRDLLHDVLTTATEYGLFTSRQTERERTREAAFWIARELVSIDHRQSLEGLGLLAVHHTRTGQPAPDALLRLGLSDEQSWDLLEELVRSLRQQGAMLMPPDVRADDERFAPRRGPIFARNTGSEAKRKVLSWVPTRGVNRRADYLQRVLTAVDSTASIDDVLKGAWAFVEGLNWLRMINDRTLGAVFQDDYEMLRFLAGENHSVFRCAKCRRVTSNSVKAVCPTLRCDGELSAFTLPEPNQDGQHYRNLYRTITPLPMSAMEHTAQWVASKAAEIQQDFVAGRVNVLSCSTTFELGVDVGDLQSVVMRNMPPTTANYVQRAGRAGRRADSAALVVTYAQRRSHDLSRFLNPEKMIAGEMRVPIIPLDNERIGRRHAHSIAIAAFFRSMYRLEGLSWTKAGQFFRQGPDGTEAPVDRLAPFLSPVPNDIVASLRNTLPASVQADIGVDSGTWVVHLIDLLATVKTDIDHEIDELEGRQQEAVEAKRFPLAAHIEKTKATIMDRGLVGFLANRNVLPKYGFPVDTVDLHTTHCDDPAGRNLELSRDLALAIYDYAPGNEVIAGGQRWKSAGLRKVPGKELPVRQFRVCGQCNYYAQDDQARQPLCPACNAAFSMPLSSMIVPEFGFVADTKSTDVGSAPPERKWGGETFIESMGVEIQRTSWTATSGLIVNARAGARGRLVAISDGIGRGYQICDWCGWGQAMGSSERSPTPRAAKQPQSSHVRPTTGKECTGPLRQMCLGHRYETDVAELTFPDLKGVTNDDDAWLSMLYAVIEGASEQLEISRDDIDGALHRTEQGERAIVLFDTVPGGAGGARLVAESLQDVIAGALQRVEHCECGVETSCYSCLRGYRNGRLHDRLSRQGALQLLEHLRPDGLATGGSTSGLLDGEWQSLVDHALSEREREVLIELAAQGVPPPLQGFESDDGVPYPLAWPSAKYALVEEAAVDLDGWTFRILDNTGVGEIASDLRQLLDG